MPQLLAQLPRRALHSQSLLLTLSSTHAPDTAAPPLPLPLPLRPLLRCPLPQPHEPQLPRPLEVEEAKVRPA